MKSIFKSLVAVSLLLSTHWANAQIKNSKTETVHIAGSCGMCKSKIEAAGNQKNVSQVVWNQETEKAELTYDASKTDKDAILKKIALAGYDSEAFYAPDATYAQLPQCCKYERVKKTQSNISDHFQHSQHTAVENTNLTASQLLTVFDNYFAVKDALVKTDGNTASKRASDLVASIDAVKMDKLSAEEHTVWMKVMKDLAFDAGHIAETKDTPHQRDHFMTLSKNMYSLIKVSKTETPTYYQYCPMANNGKGANWLSKENEVKNPYYGNQMLSCGSTVETVK